MEIRDREENPVEHGASQKKKKEFSERSKKELLGGREESQGR